MTSDRKGTVSTQPERSVSQWTAAKVIGSDRRLWCHCCLSFIENMQRRNVYMKCTLTHIHNHVNPCETGMCDSSLNTESLSFCWICGEDHVNWSCMFAGTEHDLTSVVTKTLVSVNIPVF